MAKYRKKPVVIEAFRLGYDEPPKWFYESDRLDGIYEDGSADIRTLEGVMRANKGDWVIKGVKGEIYPCKDDIFRATYEPVPEEEE